MKVRLPHNYAPRDYQLPSLAAHDRGLKRIYDVWHRRSGKDVTWFNQTIKKSWQRVGIYYYVLPTYTQARKIIWDGISDIGWRYLDYVPKAIRRGKPNETAMKIRMKNGSLVQLIGSDNYDAMVGTNPVGIVYSEYALQDPMAWEIMRPILVENGGWAAFLTTPRGHNHAYDLRNVALGDPREWYYSELGINKTKRPDGRPVVSREAVEREIKNGMDPDLARQEYDVSWEGPNQGSYWGRWMENLKHDGHITRVPHDPRLAVYTFWDLGINDSMAIWFMQYANREFRFIEYYENTGFGLDHYVKEMNNRPYTYAAHHFPHDVQVREIGNKGKTRKESLEELGVRNIKVGLALSVIDGINAVRLVLPMCYFDAEKCKLGIKHLTEFARERDEKHNTWKNNPAHGPSSHAASAMREFANSFEEVKAVAPRRAPGGDYAGPGGWMR